MKHFKPCRSSATLGLLVVAFLAACSDGDGRDPKAPSDQAGISEPAAEINAAVAANTWTTKRSMLLPARAFMKAATLNGIIYVVGGEGGGQILRNFDAYNVASNT